MKLNMDFDELTCAFEHSNAMQHYFIDTRESKLIYINEEIEDDYKEKLEKMEDERYILIPARLPRDDRLIMETFVYEIAEEDFDLAERFHEALESGKPFRNFNRLLDGYPELKERCLKHRDDVIKNETINWLSIKNIILENQQLIPEVEIRELTGDELKNLPDELRGFGPAACLKCHNKKEITARFFEVNVSPENVLIEKETQKSMKEKYGINNYGHFSGGEKELLTAARCPECGGEDIFWDY